MSKKELILSFHKKGYTNIEIEELTNYKPSSIRWAINSAGKKSNKKSPGKDLDHKYQEFILGSMLGDGSIQKDNRFSLAHSIKQKEYINSKYEFIKSYNLNGKLSYNKIINNRYKKGFCEEYRFKTLTSDKMNGMRDFYYFNNKKKVPNEEFLNEFLTPFALAIWFMDDGSACNSNLQFNTQSFTAEENLLLRYVLLNKYNIKTTINKDNIITILIESIDCFINIVNDYFIDSMKYKLVPYRKKGS